jgi:hypothetical protein
MVNFGTEGEPKNTQEKTDKYFSWFLKFKSGIAVGRQPKNK